MTKDLYNKIAGMVESAATPSGNTSVTAGEKANTPANTMVDISLVARSIKLTPLEDGWVQTVKDALGTKNTSDAIRWLISKGWAAAGEEATEAARKVRENKLG